MTNWRTDDPPTGTIAVPQSSGYDDVEIQVTPESVWLQQREVIMLLLPEEAEALAAVFDGVSKDYSVSSRHDLRWGSLSISGLDCGNTGDWVLKVGRERISGSFHLAELAKALRG